MGRKRVDVQGQWWSPCSLGRTQHEKQHLARNPEPECHEPENGRLLMMEAAT